ncbi:phosphotransferase [Bifidobacterium ramosum]|uniref:phosphotransferase n=1 Tax=Bifidobacterium ramosum TaxID=1798158 RepID=UPI003B84B579
MDRSKLKLAALTSAVMPNIVVAGVRAGTPSNAVDSANGIDFAVVQDSAGRLYDVYASDGEAGRKRLAARVRAAGTLAQAREPGGLGIALDQVLAFNDGSQANGPTGTQAVMVIAHQDGQARNLDLLTLDDCSAIGTAIGAIHRLPASVAQTGGWPAFTTGQIHAQLTAWITRLRAAGHIPSEITGSWERIIGTEGLWSFSTCFVHGGFEDGDVLFSGSTITAISNWQRMQVNDPARDLAWIFAKLDESHRNAVLAAYGRMMGSRLDDLIMLRANLWLQMEQVGEFIQALNRADNVKIMQFKAQVDRLAHQLGVIKQRSGAAAGQPKAAGAAASGQKPPSTITVGTLLNENERRRAAAAGAAGAAQRPVGVESTDPSDSTGDLDRTGSADVVAGAAARAAAPQATGSTRPQTYAAGTYADAAVSSATIAFNPLTGSVMSEGIVDELADDTNDSEPRVDAAPTIAIPLLEQEERALRDAQLGLETATHARMLRQGLTTGTGQVVRPATNPSAPAVSATSAVSSTSQPAVAAAHQPASQPAHDDNDDTGDRTPKA